MLECYYAASDLGGAPHPESTVLVWSYPSGKIVALAETAAGDTDASALKQWWRDDAGPLSHPGRVKGLVDWTVRDKRAEQTLLRTFPRRPEGAASSRT